MISTTDRIEKKVLLKAPQDRVWRAITDARQFERWFGVELQGDFTPAARLHGKIANCASEADPSAEAPKKKPVQMHVERIEPMSSFAWRWHPYTVEATYDYSKEPMTLVEFELEAADGGTMLTITESGFDSIPLARRATAFEAHEEGWVVQSERLEKYLALPSR